MTINKIIQGHTATLINVKIINKKYVSSKMTMVDIFRLSYFHLFFAQ